MEIIFVSKEDIERDIVAQKKEVNKSEAQQQSAKNSSSNVKSQKVEQESVVVKNEEPRQRVAATVKATSQKEVKAKSKPKAESSAKADNSVSKKQEEPQKEGGSWFSEAVGGIVGGAIVYGSDRVFSSDGERAEKIITADVDDEAVVVIETSQEDEEDDDVYVIGGDDDDVDFEDESQSLIDDSMSFSEAFALARLENGAGATFEWRGQVYGTYYKEEWDEMSSQEQNEFSNSVFSDDNSTDTDFGDDGYDDYDDVMVDVDDDFSVI